MLSFTGRPERYNLMIVSLARRSVLSFGAMELKKDKNANDS
jgi:hypothetical protein